ncbi:thiamine-phosphate kinase [Pseudomonadota bacterium]
MDEFSLIRKYFARHIKRPDVILGIGDDAAVLNSMDNHQLVVTTDFLIDGVHFPETTSPYDIGHKALAVNLSDLAAMGAEPAWVTLNLALPVVHEAWLRDFSEGFFDLANKYNVQLIGGDTVRGPLAIGVQAMGWVPEGKAIKRSGAQVGDEIFVTGYLGDAAMGLMLAQGEIDLSGKSAEVMLRKFNRPEPRVKCGMMLRAIATSAIDVSDGLAADLGHILEESEVGAEVYLEDLPLSPHYKNKYMDRQDWDKVVSGGDDYELCFTVSLENASDLKKQLASLNLNCTRIGRIRKQTELQLIDGQGNDYRVNAVGYNHFSGSD